MSHSLVNDGPAKGGGSRSESQRGSVSSAAGSAFAPTPKEGSLFGGSNTSTGAKNVFAVGGSIFGSGKDAADSSSTGGGLFGGSNKFPTVDPSTKSGLFAASDPKGVSNMFVPSEDIVFGPGRSGDLKGFSIFGPPATKQPTAEGAATSLFGTTSETGSGGLFGSKPTPTTQTNPMAGNALFTKQASGRSNLFGRKKSDDDYPILFHATVTAAPSTSAGKVVDIFRPSEPSFVSAVESEEEEPVPVVKKKKNPLRTAPPTSKNAAETVSTMKPSKSKKAPDAAKSDKPTGAAKSAKATDAPVAPKSNSATSSDAGRPAAAAKSRPVGPKVAPPRSSSSVSAASVSGASAAAEAPARPPPAEVMQRPSTDANPPAFHIVDNRDVWDRLEAQHERLDEPPEAFIQVIKGDESEHYVSQTEWQEMNLPELLYRNLIMNNFRRPSRIQAVALPMILHSNTHMVAQAKNGTGKTATFVLAAICKIDAADDSLQVLLLSPSKELAQQNLSVFEMLSKDLGLKGCLGSPPAMDPLPNSQLISGTPGKCLQWLSLRKLSFKRIKLFILDEADMMIDQKGGLGSQTLSITKQVRLSSPTVQILLFSATFPERVHSYAKNTAPKANRLIMRTEELKLNSILQFYLRIPLDDNAKVKAVIDMYQSLIIRQSIIFVRSRASARKVAFAVRDFGCDVGLLYGSGAMSDPNERMTQEERDLVMEEFRDGTIRCLVTTDLIARGIDVPDVSLVINYDLPMSVSRSDFRSLGAQTDREVAMETYLHRVGRTGRFGARGVAINFVCSDEEVEHIKSIEQYFGITIPEIDDDFLTLHELIKQMRPSGRVRV